MQTLLKMQDELWSIIGDVNKKPMEPNHIQDHQIQTLSAYDMSWGRKQIVGSGGNIIVSITTPERRQFVMVSKMEFQDFFLASIIF